MIKTSSPTIRGAAAVLATALATVARADAVRADAFTLDDLFRTHLVTEARVSPDGATVAYVLSAPRDPYADGDGPAWRELHVVGPEAGRHRAFIAGEVSVSKIAWLPDGSGIAFLSKRAGDEETALDAIPIDGGEARRVLSHETAIREFALSPDWSQVAFLAQERVDERKEKRAKKGFEAEVYEEEMRFVRVHVAAFDANGVLSGRNGGGGDGAEGGAVGTVRTLDLEGSASLLSWSPTGDRLAVALAPTPSVDDGLMKRRLHVVDARTDAVDGVVETRGKLTKAVWSPDGKSLALLAGADEHDPDACRLMVVDAGGGTPRDLRPGWLGDAIDLAFLDDRTLIYVAHENLATYLARQEIDAAKATVIVAKGQAALRSLDVARDGGVAVLIGDTAEHPREVFRWRSGRGTVERLTDSNPWLVDVTLARQEAVRYPARDGLEIDGLLLHPVDAGDGPHPLVVIVHGGPESHYSDGLITRYVTPGQALAARGFAVFYPNYRGSTGRGVEFSMAGQGDYAGGEFDDLVEGIGYLAARGLIDPVNSCGYRAQPRSRTCSRG